MKIYTALLTNGSEIIFKGFFDEEKQCYIVEKPMLVTLTPSGHGSLIPALLSADSDASYTLKEHQYIFITDKVQKSVKDQYTTITSNLIVGSEAIQTLNEVKNKESKIIQP